VNEAEQSKGTGSEFDLLIVRGGSAGFAAAIKGAGLAARVAMAEEGTLGGTCVNVGCVPSRTLLPYTSTSVRHVERFFGRSLAIATSSSPLGRADARPGSTRGLDGAHGLAAILESA